MQKMSFESESHQSELEVIPYGFFIIYASVHDNDWLSCVSKFRELIDSRINRAGLPSEVIRNILSYMDAPSVLKCGTLNKTWWSLSEEEILWKSLCIAKFHVEPSACRFSGKSKTFYRAMRESFRSLVYQRDKTAMGFKSLPTMFVSRAVF